MCVSGGSVFVADTNNHRIQVYKLDGSFVSSWGSVGSGQGQLHHPSGVCVSGGSVFVSDSGNHRIQVLK